GDDGPVRQAVEDIRRIDGPQGTLTRYALAAWAIWRIGHGHKADLEEVRQHLDHVASQRPAWPVVHLARAEMEIFKGNDEQAVAHFRRASELGERSPRVVRKLVELLYQRQRYAEADQEMRRLQKEAVIAADLHRLAADLSLRNDDAARAVELATEAGAPDSHGYPEHPAPRA